jgi:FKBP-type peptidyl-prolyl cis-trans isomerase FklB
MKLFVGMMMLISPFLYAGVLDAADSSLKTPKDKVSYAVGAQIGADMKRQTVDIDPAVLAKGLKDSFQGSKLLLTDQEMREALSGLQQQMAAKQAERMRELGAKNKQAGAAFLAENKKKEDVKVLPSGLQYKITKEGTGKTPKADDTVTVNYRGTLIDGTEFDSSYKRGEPATFLVKGVIKGWTEALQLMKVGSKWQLFIPSELAYGEQSAGRVIGPNSTLIFEVELLGIKE